MKYYLIKDGASGRQTSEDLSFAGGLPNLPPDALLPCCSLCAAPMTFFFQLEFPRYSNQRGGGGVAMFYCVACGDPDHILPPRAKPGKAVSRPLAKKIAESNFKVVCFDPQSTILRRDYQAAVLFQRWQLVPDDPAVSKGSRVSRIGGSPVWAQGDESPGPLHDGRQLHYLMQFDAGPVFKTKKGARVQMRPAMSGRKKQERSRLPGYALFAGNVLYFFGTSLADGAPDFCYLVAQ